MERRMIIYETPELRLREYLGFPSFSKGNLHICLERVREFFVIPADTKSVQFIVHNHPAEDRVELTAEDLGGIIEFSLDGEEVSFYYTMNSIVNRHMAGRDQLYIQCVYEEGAP